MANEEAQAAAQATTTTTEQVSVLEQAISATKQTDRSRVEELMRALTDEALKGTVTWNKNVTQTLQAGIRAIDQAMSKQLAAVMHSPDLQKLEGTWRGLHHLVMNSETSAQLKIKVLNVNKRELFKDLTRAVEFDQSQLFKKLYENEFGSPGGEPYGALIGDYEIANHPDDVELLSKMSNVAAAAFCPFITASDPGMFGFSEWSELSKPRDLEKIFESVEYAKWRGYRDSEDSRFVSLVMPRVLARLPFGANSKPIEEFGYEECELDDLGRPKPVPHDHYTWMNASYVMGTKLTDAFAKYGFCVAIRGAEGGGKVEGLPAHVFVSDDGDPDLKCPTEVGITDRREAELSKMGFLPLCHYKNTDYAVFFGAQTTQKAKKYDRPDATANAAISARLPYIMATSRFAHYLKVMARDKIGSFMEAENCEDWLNRWINNYVNANERAGAEMKAKYPLREAKVEVKEIPGKPGSYNAVAYLRPWLQMEELTASLRMVARIPKMGG
jgi:type VI secretion system protein ImpC